MELLSACLKNGIPNEVEFPLNASSKIWFKSVMRFSQATQSFALGHLILLCLPGCLVTDFVGCTSGGLVFLLGAFSISTVGHCGCTPGIWTLLYDLLFEQSEVAGLSVFYTSPSLGGCTAPA